MAILEVIREVVEINMLLYPPFTLGSLLHLPRDPSRRCACPTGLPHAVL